MSDVMLVDPRLLELLAAAARGEDVDATVEPTITVELLGARYLAARIASAWWRTQATSHAHRQDLLRSIWVGFARGCGELGLDAALVLGAFDGETLRAVRRSLGSREIVTMRIEAAAEPWAASVYDFWTRELQALSRALQRVDE